MTTDAILGCIWALIALVCGARFAGSHISNLIRLNPLKEGEFRPLTIYGIILTLLSAFVLMIVSYSLYTFADFCSRFLIG